MEPKDTALGSLFFLKACCNTAIHTYIQLYDTSLLTLLGDEIIENVQEVQF